MELLILLVIGYFIPFLVSLFRKKKNTVAIFFLNLLAGWTIIGWVVAFIWSLTKEQRVA
ncbi:hypothetical protein BN1058_00859 [Paraliobacillus sp. PM-2]|uniref:superinfection immunity protein n=1 Tax=Paraliobacillus sp. PM-2 TaxID=1462524 RepID=UPI00061CD615|nr:superinfection immunity protein [Paraliobacillus sp. PM-2]CQR46590.1 hypothetical protein BN1058_00859 [Paraliobacillus sp. PM-2]